MEIKKTLKQMTFIATIRNSFAGIQYDDTVALIEKIETPNYKMNNYEIRLRKDFEDFINRQKREGFFDEELMKIHFTPNYKKMLPNSVD